MLLGAMQYAHPTSSLSDHAQTFSHVHSPTCICELLYMQLIMLPNDGTHPWRVQTCTRRCSKTRACAVPGAFYLSVHTCQRARRSWKNSIISSA